MVHFIYVISAKVVLIVDKIDMIYLCCSFAFAIGIPRHLGRFRVLIEVLMYHCSSTSVLIWTQLITTYKVVDVWYN